MVLINSILKYNSVTNYNRKDKFKIIKNEYKIWAFM